MLKLFCAKATPVIRRLLRESFIESRGEDGTVFIVPNAEFAERRVRKWALHAGRLQTGAIVGLDEFTSWIVRPELEVARSEAKPRDSDSDTFRQVDLFEDPQPDVQRDYARCIVQPGERLAILRSILLGAPSRFDRLVGGRSAPHLTYGVLQRISDAVQRVLDHDRAAGDAAEEEQQSQSQRSRQLRNLGRQYEQRLEREAAIEWRAAMRQGWSELTAHDLQKLLPNLKRVVLDGFAAFDELTILAVRRLRDTATDTLLLLDYDPEADSERYSHLQPAYERLYDVADSTIMDPAAFAENEESRFQSYTAVGRMTVVDAQTCATEVEAIARYLRAELDGAIRLQSDFNYQDYLVCFPDLPTYVPLVEDTFGDYGLPYNLRTSEPILKHPLTLLLEAIRNAVVSGGSFASIRELLKSPLLPAALLSYGVPADISTIDQAQTMDLLRREEGLNSAGRQLLTDVRRVIARDNDYLASLEEAGLDSEGENTRAWLLRERMDAFRRLGQTLESVSQLLQDIGVTRSLEHWRDRLSPMLNECRDLAVSAPTIPESTRFNTAYREVLYALNRVVACSRLLSSDEVSFEDCFAMLRVILRSHKAENNTGTQYGFAIRDVPDAQGFEPRVLIVGGLTDGQFPRYINRESRLEDDTFSRLDQTHYIARQRMQFEQLIASSIERTILFVPRADSDGELLESQFVEELYSEYSEVTERLSSAEFISALAPHSRSATEILQAIADSLKSEAKLSSGVKDNIGSQDEFRILENIIHNVCAEDERCRPDALGSFDGFLSEPQLVNFVRRHADAHVHSVSQLDTLVQCPFRYFVENVLGVRELKELEEGTAPRRMGELVHSILASFYREWVQDGRGVVNAASRADAGVMLAGHAEKELARANLSAFERDSLAFRLYGSRGIGGLPGEASALIAPPMFGVRDYPGVLPAFLDLEVQRSEEAGGHMLKPRFFELGFGLPSRYRDGSDDESLRDPIELQLTPTRRIRLRGRADRVDADDSIFAIIDYKTGGMPTIAAQKEGYKVQVPVYLLAIEQLLAKRGVPLRAAGGMFVALSPKEAKVGGQFFRKSLLDTAGLQGKQGLTEDVFAESMDRVRQRIADGLQRFESGYFHVTLAGEKIACTYCGNARICRKDLERAEVLVPQVCGT